MNAELEAIKAAWTAGTEAKQEVMAALGRAKLADRDGGDSKADWKVVADKGIHGTEGAKKQEAVDLSDAYVEAHPDEFTIYREMSLEECVKTYEVFSQNGMEEQAWRVQAWLWHHFEPQVIGGKAQARIRFPGGKG